MHTLAGSVSNGETEETNLNEKDVTVTATFKLNKQEHIRHIVDYEECEETTDAVACKLVASQIAFKEYTPKGTQYISLTFKRCG